jgi:hypothetical protein
MSAITDNYLTINCRLKTLINTKMYFAKQFHESSFYFQFTNKHFSRKSKNKVIKKEQQLQLHNNDNNNNYNNKTTSLATAMSVYILKSHGKFLHLGRSFLPGSPDQIFKLSVVLRNHERTGVAKISTTSKDFRHMLSLVASVK